MRVREQTGRDVLQTYLGHLVWYVATQVPFLCQHTYVADLLVRRTVSKPLLPFHILAEHS